MVGRSVCGWWVGDVWGVCVCVGGGVGVCVCMCGCVCDVGCLQRTGYSLCTLNGRFHVLKIATICRVLCRNSQILIQER